MTNYDKLIRYFEDFPGIGSRQAKRFINHLLVQPEADLTEFAELVKNIQSSVATCDRCFRFFNRHIDETSCSICTNPERDEAKLMVLERDADLLAIERSGTYDGLYFILGGTISLLNSDDTKKLRGGALKARVAADNARLEEIILAFAVNPDGENTARYVESLLKEIIAETSTKVSYLGRGLSTGSELEYADPETIKSALQNRS